MSEAAQSLCFYADANSLFHGAKLLTAANAPLDRTRQPTEMTMPGL